jgi:hypothetical protein
MSDTKTNLGPCAVCRLDVYDEDGAAFSFEGEIIHPWGSNCYSASWGDDASPLSEGNTRTAVNVGRMLAAPLTSGQNRRVVEIVLWLRNLTPTDRKPPDGIVFEVDRYGDARVAIALDYENVRQRGVDELDDARWLPLDDAPYRLLSEWADLLPLTPSRNLLSTFVTIVRESKAATT